jgi:hypothetical protein
MAYLILRLYVFGVFDIFAIIEENKKPNCPEDH